jgi:hypothetical protein
MAVAEAFTANRNARAAAIATQKADSSARSTRTALKALAVSDSQRARAHAIADSVTETGTAALKLMNKDLLASRDSVLLAARKTIVNDEVADQYIRMGGQLRAWRAAADSAYAQTVKRTVDSATSILAQANQRSAGQVSLLQRILCGSPQVPQVKGQPGDSAAEARVRNEIRTQLESGGLLGRDSLCAVNRSKAGQAP